MGSTIVFFVLGLLALAWWSRDFRNRRARALLLASVALAFVVPGLLWEALPKTLADAQALGPDVLAARHRLMDLSHLGTLAGLLGFAGAAFWEGRSRHATPAQG